jgi:hypothetical protein
MGRYIGIIVHGRFPSSPFGLRMASRVLGYRVQGSRIKVKG